MQSLNRIAFLSIFIAASIVVFVVESMYPTPIPGIRLGLANIFILLALLSYGIKEAFLIGMLKSILGSLILGRLFTPSFLFSLSGTAVSIMVMWLILKSKMPFSLLGISIIGAEAHTMTQLILATSIFLPCISFLYISPIFIISSLITGSVVGIITYLIYSKTERRFKFCVD
jgi:heptaprenyl diphosphate synthase